MLRSAAVLGLAALGVVWGLGRALADLALRAAAAEADLDGDFECRAQAEAFAQRKGDVGVVIAVDEGGVAELADAPFGALRPFENAGDGRHEYQPQAAAPGSGARGELGGRLRATPRRSTDRLETLHEQD